MIELRRYPAHLRNLETVFTLAYDHSRHTYLLMRREGDHGGPQIVDDETARVIIEQIQKGKLSGTMPSDSNRFPQKSLLNPREAMVLQAVAEGLTNRAIGLRLEISENTVKRHLQSIFAKLDVTSRTQAAMLAVSRGWISSDRALMSEQSRAFQ